MTFCLFLLPLFGALFGWLSLSVFHYALFQWIIPNKLPSIKEAAVQKLSGAVDFSQLFQKMEEIDFASEIEPFIDQRLDHLVDQLKPSIPMGEVLLSGALAKRLKERAKTEILDAIPEIKLQIIKKIESGFDSKQIMEEQLQHVEGIQLAGFIRGALGEEFTRIKALCALAGLLFGFLELVLFLLIC